MFKNILKHFLWGKVGKYEFFFVILQRNSEKGEIYKEDNINNFRANQIAPHSPTRLIGDPAFPGATGKTIHSVNWYINPKNFNFAVVNRIGGASNG